MKYSHLVSRVLAASLLAASLLSVTALAAPAGVDSATAIRVRRHLPPPLPSMQSPAPKAR